MSIYCLEGEDDGGHIIYRVFTHACGNYARVTQSLANRRHDLSSLNGRMMSIEDVMQITNKGGQYLYQTIRMAESPDNCGLSFFAVEMIDGASDVNLWGPNNSFVRGFEIWYRNNNNRD